MTKDWSPLAGSDPVPGEPYRIAALARHLTDTGVKIHDQAAALRDTQSGWWRGRAADEFVKHQEKLPPLLTDVALRYFNVAKALDAYHPQLENAQEMAREALRRAQAAELAMEVARDGLVAMQQHAYAEEARVSAYNAEHPKQPPAQPAPWSGPNWPSALQAAQDDMDAARRLLDDAVSLRDESAAKTADRIRDVIDDDLKNEGGLSGWAKRTARHLVDVLPLEELSVILAVAGVVLLFVAASPFVIAAVAVGALLVDGALFLAGEKEGWEFALTAIGFGAFAITKIATALNGLRVVTNTTSAVTRISAPGVRAVATSSSLSRGLSTTKLVGTIHAGTTRLVASGSTVVTTAVRSTTTVSRLPGAAFFPSVARIASVFDKGSTVVGAAYKKNIVQDLRDYRHSAVEFTDEMLLEPALAPLGFPSGIYRTPEEQAEQRGADVAPVTPDPPIAVRN